MRKGMCFSGVAGLRRMVWTLLKAAKSSVEESGGALVSWSLHGGRELKEGGLLSCTEFHSCVEFSFDMDIIPFAVPFRTKSACHQSIDLSAACEEIKQGCHEPPLRY